ncbi:MAG: hypothetical protein VYC17_05800 [Nitrospinota bacterium]|nr:hypothetical protein [Nitrospinota bacterium]
MKNKILISLWLFCFLFFLFPFVASPQPGGQIRLDKGTITPDKLRWINIGGGVRSSFTSVEDASPSGSDTDKTFEVENMRFYVNALVASNIEFEFNTERDATGGGTDVRILDAVGKFRFTDLFQVWGGRFLPPSDRSNLNGPYFLNIWDFPFVQAYPAIFAGRDNGVSLWGITANKRFKYQIGAFEGTNASTSTGATTPNQEDNLLYAGRVTYNFWDPEPAIYYNQSSYYGDIDVLAIGFAGMVQNDGAGTATAQGDYGAWNVDFLMEKKLLNKGVVTLEGAYYDYDLDGRGSVDARGLVEGDSWFALASYMFPHKWGWGKLQPVFRYQELDRQVGTEHDRYDIGVNYIIAGHNARISAIYSKDDDPSLGINNVDRFKLGLQLQLF